MPPPSPKAKMLESLRIPDGEGMPSPYNTTIRYSAKQSFTSRCIINILLSIQKYCNNEVHNLLNFVEAIPKTTVRGLRIREKGNKKTAHRRQKEMTLGTNTCQGSFRYILGFHHWLTSLSTDLPSLLWVFEAYLVHWYHLF